MQKKAWLIFKISLILDVLNGVWLDTYILQIIIEFFKKYWILKIYNFQSKLNIFTKLKERIPLTLMSLVKKIKKISNLCCEDKNIDLIEKGSKNRYVLIKFLNTFIMITRYTVEDNIFVVIVYKLLEQQAY